MKTLVSLVLLLGCSSLAVADWYITTQYSDAGCTTPTGYSIIDHSPTCATPYPCTETTNGQYFTGTCVDTATDPFDPVPEGWVVFQMWETNTGSCSATAPNNFFAPPNTCVYYGDSLNFKLTTDCGTSDSITLTYHEGDDCSQSATTTFQINSPGTCTSVQGAIVNFDGKAYCYFAPPVAAPVDSPAAGQAAPVDSPVAAPVAGGEPSTPVNNAPVQQAPNSQTPTKKTNAASVVSSFVIVGLISRVALLM